MTKPCEVGCSKCGSTEIHRQFYEKGEEVSRPFGEAKGKSTALVKRSEYDWKAKKDCIVHHCRTCQYERDDIPLDSQPTPTLNDVIDQTAGRRS